MTKENVMVPRLQKKMYAMSCVCGSACGAICLPAVRIEGEDVAEAVHLEAKTYRNKHGATINYG